MICGCGRNCLFRFLLMVRYHHTQISVFKKYSLQLGIDTITNIKYFLLCRFRITTLRLCQGFDVWSCKRSSRGCKIRLLVNVEFIHGTCFISFISGQFGFLDSNSRATILVTLVILDRKSIPNLQC